MENNAAKTAPCGSWKSPITSDLIVTRSIGLSEVQIEGDEIYWLEARPQEAGRNVVVRRSPDDTRTELNAAPLNVRTRVHEYGGGAWKVSGGALFFSNDSDRRLYRLDRDAHPVPITPVAPEGAQWRYADGIIDAGRNRWIGVREEHDPQNAQAVNTIVEIDLSTPGAGPGHVLVSGHDFFSSPQLSWDGRYLAWLAWDHPNMPWVGTTLHLARVNEDGAVDGQPIAIAGGLEESLFQPRFAPDSSSILFVSDKSGWWNLYRYDLTTGSISPLAPFNDEFGVPQWNFGLSTYSFLDAQTIICSFIRKGLGKLAVLDLITRELRVLDLPYTDYSSIQSAGNRRIAFRAGGPSYPSCIVLMNLSGDDLQVLKKSTEVGDNPELNKYFTQVQPVEFPTTGGKSAFGLYYAPYNPDFAPLPDEKPPLVVKCHGGPTSMAGTTLNLGIQYWTTRGIAVLDVNYGGSTGYGREYRNRLNRTWGIVDVDDCVNGAKHLAQNGLADPARSVITGGSAGGYTTLAALTFRDYFRGGGSHYGISDVAALARDTHKFESRYMDWLIGRYPEEEEVYKERSPIWHAERLSAPVIFLQGDEDRVVPQSQTEEMVNALRKNGKPVGYLLFCGEQHGFRQAANIKRALDAELYFYSVEVFGAGLTF